MLKTAALRSRRLQEHTRCRMGGEQQKEALCRTGLQLTPGTTEVQESAAQSLDTARSEQKPLRR